MTTEDTNNQEQPAAEEGAPRRRRSRSGDSAEGGQGSGRSQRSSRSRQQEQPEGEQQANGASPVEVRPLPRLLEKLRNEVGPALMQEFGYTSPMQIPRFQKIVLNIGLGEALQNARAMENATRDLTAIAGQLPMTTRAKKSIAGFKIRDGMPIGLSVTLRSRRMYEFLDRLISSTLPRIRDFQGVSRNSFDGRGNYSLGLREQIIFPEIDYNTIDRIRGLQIVIVTTARTDREGFRLLESMGLPFERPVETVSGAA